MGDRTEIVRLANYVHNPLFGICWETRSTLKLLNPKLKKFMLRLGLIQRYTKDPKCNYLPYLVTVIVEAMIKETSKRRKILPRWTNADVTNLLLASQGFVKAFQFDTYFVFKFWPTYFDCAKAVCQWIGENETAVLIQRMKKEVLLIYGHPPFTPEKTMVEMHTVRLPDPEWSLESTVSATFGNSVKTDVNIKFIGEAGSGKSTTAGYLIYKCGGIDKASLEKLEKRAQKMASFKFTFQLTKSRVQFFDPRMTSEQALWMFETTNLFATIKDSPVYRETECAVLVVDGSLWKLDADRFKRKGQILEQIRGAESIGVIQIIVVVNKMDLTEPPYSEARYLDIEMEVRSLIQETSYDPLTVPFIPISGWHGDNVLKASANLPWYNGWHMNCQGVRTTGKSLLEAINNTQIFSKPTDQSSQPPASIAEMPDLDLQKVISICKKCEHGKIRRKRLTGHFRSNFNPTHF